MATYAFMCRACGEEFEVIRPMGQRAELDSSPPSRPTCGKHHVKKLVSTLTAIKDWRIT